MGLVSGAAKKAVYQEHSELKLTVKIYSRGRLRQEAAKHGWVRQGESGIGTLSQQCQGISRQQRRLIKFLKIERSIKNGL